MQQLPNEDHYEHKSQIQYANKANNSYERVKTNRRKDGVFPLPGILDHRDFQRSRICLGKCELCGDGRAAYHSKEQRASVCEKCYTRLVRVFGKGDSHCGGRYQLLELSVSLSGKRWQISPSQEKWPGEYATWVQILNDIAGTLNNDGISCPHPPQYLQSGRREEGKWLPADVETALFSYASQVVKESNKTALSLAEPKSSTNNTEIKTDFLP